MLFGGVVDFWRGGIRGGEADTMRGSIPAYFDTDYSFLSFIGKIETIFLLCDKAPEEPEDNMGVYRICGTITNYR